MSVKSKILVPAFIIIALSYIILGYTMLSNSYRGHYLSLKDKEVELSKNSAKYMSDYLESKVEIINSLTKQIVHFNRTGELEHIRKLLILSKEAGGFNSVYAGFEKDGFMTRWSGRDTLPQRDGYDPRIRPWYKAAFSGGKGGVTKPYIDSATKKLTISVFAPIRKGGDIVGVVGSDIFLDKIVKTVLDINIEDYGFAYLIDKTGEILIHKDKEEVNKKNSVFEELVRHKEGFAQLSLKGVEKLISFSKVETTGWYLCIELDKEKAFAKIYDELMLFSFISIFFLIVTIIGFYYFLNKSLSVLNSFQSGLLNFFKYLNKESSTVEVLDDRANDEFGAMSKVINENIQKTKKLIEEDQKLIDEAKTVINRVKHGWYSQQIESNTQNSSLNEFKNDVNEMIKETKEHFSNMNIILEEYARYDYRKELKLEGVEKGGVFERLINDINSLRNSISQMLVENKVNGLTLQNSADDLLENVQTLSSASNEAAASLEQTAAALEEITSNIANNTQNISQMADHANSVTRSVNEGQELASRTTVAMDEINNEVTEINDAITVIDQIAFQTNILSLNAAVEAATAGEAGKGFAVVAGEVRNLASRSAEAANEIKKLVENATGKANNGKNISDEMKKGYEYLNESIVKTIDLIKNVENASKEQTLGIEQINDAVSELDRQTQQNANIANNTQQIALQTQNIANDVVRDAEEKEFSGKNEARAKNIGLSPAYNTKRGNIPKPSHKVQNSSGITPVVSADHNGDEWSSF